jgi:hypothetical protein
MSEQKLLYGSATSMTITLASVINGSSATSSTVDNTVNLFVDVLVELVMTLPATGTVATGTVEVWAKGSVDNSDFDDDVNDRLVGIMVMAAAGAQTRKKVFSLAASFGGTVPPYWQLRVRNATGGTVTSGTLVYRGATLQSV